MDSRCDVVVIGAGLSGLMAATRLRTAGRSVVVLEAHPSAGGRVRTLRDDAWGAIDLGAQWVSPRHHRVLALAAAYGLRVEPSPMVGDAAVVLGGRIHRGGATAGVGPLDTVRLIVRALRLRFGLVTRDRAVTMRTWAGAGPAGLLLRARIEESFCQDADRVGVREVVDQLRSVGGLRALASAEALIIADGAGTIAERLAAGLGDGLRTGWPVQRIEREGSGFAVHGPEGTVRADRLVLAMPPESAQRIPGPHQPAYVPHLSGRVVKAHLRYRTPWWRERGWSGTAQIDDGFVAATADRSPSTGGRGILVALSTGPHADRLRALPVADRPGALAAAVEQIMPGAPAPEAVHLQDWCADPWIPGGYASHPAPGIGPWRPRPPAGIAIAGTEAATVWRSYMEGALAAGEAAATALLAAP